jgi:ATP-dependent Lhr-like helicase
MVERFREQLSTEKLADRLARILKEANAQIDASEATASSSRAARRKIGA